MSIKDLLDLNLITTEKMVINVVDVLMVILILVITRLVLWGLKKMFGRASNSKNVEIGKSHAYYQIIKYFLWVIAIALAMDTIGFKITFLLASSAALLVGLGLGLQQIFKDIISGVFLLFEGTIKLNDIVELDGYIGKVKKINIRNTKIETRDNIIVIIPNSTFIEKNVINWSHISKRTRFKITVGVAYGSDVQMVKRILLNCVKNHLDITKTPEPFVRFEDFGDSALIFEVFFWTNNAFWVENIKSDVRFLIDAEFRKNNVRIPFPQRDVHFFDNKGKRD